MTPSATIWDELLKAVSERLTTCVREVDTVARMGGDEFTIILEGVSSEQNILVVAKRITESIATPFELMNHHISVAVSIGITIYPLDDHPVDELLKHADTAMYRAKQQGGSAFHLYEASGAHSTNLPP